jgi:hypothetical protein
LGRDAMNGAIADGRLRLQCLHDGFEKPRAISGRERPSSRAAVQPDAGFAIANNA